MRRRRRRKQKKTASYLQQHVNLSTRWKVILPVVAAPKTCGTHRRLIEQWYRFSTILLRPLMRSQSKLKVNHTIWPERFLMGYTHNVEQGHTDTQRQAVIKRIGDNLSILFRNLNTVKNVFISSPQATKGFSASFPKQVLLSETGGWIIVVG
jgi:hypothetical protein